MERVGVRELDLSNCGPGSVAERVGVVPGLRSSAAFFTFLRANLALSPSALSSNYNTPYLEPYSPQPPQLKPPSPSPLATDEPLIPLDEIPPLSLDTLETQDEKIDGLRLVADSVTEMRQRASKAVILHPLCLAGLVTSWVAVYRFAYTPDRDAARSLMLASGITMLYMAAVRFITSGYDSLAEKIGWDWLRADFGGEEDIILGAHMGETLVGAVVLRLESKRPPLPSPKRKSRSRSASLRGGKGVIRAWTTKYKYRGQGVGKKLLHEAVRLARERCGKDAQVGFALEHANSTMLLPNMFNAAFRRDEVRAAKALEGAVLEWDVAKKKKR
ncbi:GCN5-related N-acetyltransferase (GNAT) domain-containing protein [Pochonia chlamydosporia 170]|uniref:GCN5-related N-acetyltransferase (GNAT) domain-containing protein n=1 Tax=Pochonia chlamydosporia 170 TaxID=1380566 RepID=A0A179FUX1_METCM|nr:GCN5-related N-acetyltransferase (GNAT) domain-containing protein [Pochonia chlamydosporia 170]OAQ69038.1 GCN5-related N-acetyltransferase (GNAT) domain-containing protein [Pochonia chlamydosporia 170]